MPCSPEHLKKLDAMFDAFFAPKKDAAVTVNPAKKENCAPFSDKSERNELRTGALSKKE
jgi:hypothetical protein